MTNDPVRSTIHRLQRRLIAEDKPPRTRPFLSRIQEALQRDKWANDLPPAQDLPVLSQLDGDLQPLATRLSWSTFYARNEITEDFLDRFAIAELISPQGPLISHDFIVGIFILGRHNTYPLHRHAATEYYHLVRGGADFSAADGDWQPHDTDALIYVPSGVAHTLRTGDAPMIALYAWCGDVAKPPRFVVGGRDVIAQKARNHQGR